MVQTENDTRFDENAASITRPEGEKWTWRHTVTSLCFVGFIGVTGVAVHDLQEEAERERILEFYRETAVDSVFNADGTLDLERSKVIMPLKKVEDLRLRLEE